MMSSRLAYCILFSAVIRVSLAIWDHTMSVLKLSRSAAPEVFWKPERRSGTSRQVELGRSKAERHAFCLSKPTFLW